MQRHVLTKSFAIFLALITSCHTVLAGPVVFVPQNPTSQSTSTPPGSQPPTTELQKLIVVPDSPEQPEFIKLLGGQTVPFGAGIVCDDFCPTLDAVTWEPTSRNLAPWLFWGTVGGVITIITVIPRRPPTDTSTTTVPRPFTTPTPGSTPPPPVTAVPEPGTLVLEGLGLACLAWAIASARRRRVA